MSTPSPAVKRHREQPLKACWNPKCCCLVHIACRYCPHCGVAFKMPRNHSHKK